MKTPQKCARNVQTLLVYVSVLAARRHYYVLGKSITQALVEMQQQFFPAWTQSCNFIKFCQR